MWENENEPQIEYAKYMTRSANHTHIVRSVVLLDKFNATHFKYTI